MNDSKIRSLRDIRAFLDGTGDIDFAIEDKDQRYQWIECTLKRFNYRALNRPDRGLVLRYLQRVSGYSRQTITRLVKHYQDGQPLKRRQRTTAGFVRHYTEADVALLAELDALHSTPCGQAAKKLCERLYHVHGDLRYEALSHISVSHLYNLRKANGYRRRRRHFDKTRPKRANIAHRRKPNPNGQPGFLRIDTVHQGDFDGVKGVYHINAVDQVTQFQCVLSVERISEHFLIPVLEMILETFPFRIQGFHADNGSEYINHRVAKLLNTLNIEFTKSRPRHSNDNALAESKNASVVRKHLGFEHIPGHYAPRLNAFHREHFNPYLNYHRPCLFPVPHIDQKGRIKKRYPYNEMDTPYGKLKSLPNAADYLKPHITFKQLDEIALQIDDNEAAKRLNNAKRELFKTIFEQGKQAG